MHICRRSTTPTTRERLFEMGSGPPKTGVVGRWSRGGPGLLRVLGRRDLFLAFRSDGVVVPAWSVGTEGSERGRLCVALVCRPLALGSAIRAVWVDGRGIRGVWCPYVGHQTPQTSRIEVRGVSGSNMEPRATQTSVREMRVGSNVIWTSKPSWTGRPSWSVSSGPSYARGTRPGPSNARWRRERVGRAVIRDVVIRAAPVRCPHSGAPNHATARAPNASDHPSAVAIVTERRLNQPRQALPARAQSLPSNRWIVRLGSVTRR